jgi:antitoxin VapB
MSKPISPIGPPARRASVFRNGRNQAVRIPRDFEFQADEVMVVKDGERLILEPLSREPSLLEVLAALEPLDETFPDVDEGLGKVDEVKIP